MLRHTRKCQKGSIVRAAALITINAMQPITLTLQPQQGGAVLTCAAVPA